MNKKLKKKKTDKKTEARNIIDLDYIQNIHKSQLVSIFTISW